MFTLFIAFAVVTIAVVAYQFSCFLEYQDNKEGAATLSLSPEICTEP
ncbi:hypothetical protein L4X63_02275 [Geomonas sp. Red32]|nr:hypothetical protein [Geomonas sp. Red32]MCM0080406.1 hypothetical protein [Geomonas sp. Red32]